MTMTLFLATCAVAAIVYAVQTTVFFNGFRVACLWLPVVWLSSHALEVHRILHQVIPFTQAWMQTRQPDHGLVDVPTRRSRVG
jgi:hypothetical protein